MPCILLYNKGWVGPKGTQITKVCTNVHTCMYICHLAPPPPVVSGVFVSGFVLGIFGDTSVGVVVSVVFVGGFVLGIFGDTSVGVVVSVVFVSGCVVSCFNFHKVSDKDI